MKKKPKWYVEVALRNTQEVTLNTIQSMVWDALMERDAGAELHRTFGSFVIFQKDRKFFKLSYSVLDGEVQLGTEETPVDEEWVETRSAQAESDEDFETTMRLDNPKDAGGSVWDVTICEAGFTKNGWYLPEDVLRSAQGLFEGVDVNLYELDSSARHVPHILFDAKRLLSKNKVGWVENVRYVAGEGLKGVLHFLDSAKWIGKNLLGAFRSGMEAYGLSYDCGVRAKKDTVENRNVIAITKILRADSVDIVTRPAAGGKFNRALAALDNAEESIMNKAELWALIMRMRPDLLKGRAIADMTEDEVRAVADGMTPASLDPGAEPGADPGGGTGSQTPVVPDNMATKDDLALLRCEMALDSVLPESDLPEKSQDRVRKMFAGRVFAAEELTRAVADEKDFLAAVTTDPAGDGIVVASDIRVGIGTMERAQMAVDRMFGLTGEEMKGFAKMKRLDHQPFFDLEADPVLRSVQDLESYDDVPVFSGIREMYTFFSGDPDVSGRFNRAKLAGDLRSSMAIDSSTFTYVLGNTLGRRLIKDYRETNFQEDLLISIRKSVRDFRQQEAVMVGYFGDLDDVDPETADYQEIAAVTDEESTYSLGQKGNILTFSRKVIINDDQTVIPRLVGRFGKAARRTHAKFVWAFFIDNSTVSDGTNWFTNGHGNLGSAALSFAQALVAYKALANMTEKDSGETIGLLDDPGVMPTLVYPVALMETGESVVEDEHFFATNDLTDKTRNPMKGKIKGARVSLLSDANDWGMLMPPDVVDMVEMGYLNGRTEPEMFVADSPQGEQMFVADETRYKIRHEYSGAAVDFRSGWKAQVT